MARFTTDRLAMFAVATAAFVLMAVAPACAMPECLGISTAMDMECDPYMTADDAPEGVTSASSSAPIILISSVSVEPVPEVALIDRVTPLSMHAPPLTPLGERLTV